MLSQLGINYSSHNLDGARRPIGGVVDCFNGQAQLAVVQINILCFMRYVFQLIIGSLPATLGLAACMVASKLCTDVAQGILAISSRKCLEFPTET